MHTQVKGLAIDRNGQFVHGSMQEGQSISG